jgi:hypothetical protein
MTCGDKIRKMPNADLAKLFICISFSDCIRSSLFEEENGEHGESTARFCANHRTCRECVKEALETEV